MTDLKINVSRIETPRGPVEFSVAGSGPPILYFHGTPSSSRLVIDMERQLIAGGFQLIVPQRPGYYGTTLGDRVTTADCADLFAQVLDHLKIERAVAIGTSGGGPPVLAFAIRHPERTSAVILQCAQTHRWDNARWAPGGHRWLYRCFRQPLARWWFCQFFPTLFRIRFPSAERYLRDVAGSRFSTIQNEIAAMQFASGFEEGLADFRDVRRGYSNDVRSWTQEDVLSTGSVRCPTLLLHDPQDPAAPFCHAEYAAAKIPGAEIIELNTGGHLIWYGPDANLMHQRRTAFLREHSKH